VIDAMMCLRAPSTRCRPANIMCLRPASGMSLLRHDPGSQSEVRRLQCVSSEKSALWGLHLLVIPLSQPLYRLSSGSCTIGMEIELVVNVPRMISLIAFRPFPLPEVFAWDRTVSAM